ncbi:MAG: hypothetical protein WCT85_05010 [Parachlamydiales bacterium]|jgi:hypothetical protein
MTVCATVKIYDDSKSIALGNTTNLGHLKRELLCSKSRDVGLLKIKDEFYIVSLSICLKTTRKIDPFFSEERYSFGIGLDEKFENIDVMKVKIEEKLEGITKLDPALVSFKVHFGCEHNNDGGYHITLEKEKRKTVSTCLIL